MVDKPLIEIIEVDGEDIILTSTEEDATPITPLI